MPSQSLAILSALFFLFWLPLAHGDEAAEKLVLATYKLANESSTATGTVYRREIEEGKSHCLLVTAAHVFEAMKGDACVLVSRTQREDGVFMRQDIQVPVRREGKPLWKKHTAEDIAVLLLPESISVDIRLNFFY